MIRVIHMLDRLDGIGGTARLLLYLVRHSDPKAIRHDFICMRPGELQWLFEAAGAAVFVVGSTSPVAVLRAAIKHGKSGGVDVLATHFTRSMFCGALAAKWLGCDWIHNEHGPAVPELEKRSPVGALGRLARRYWLRHSDAVICNSYYTARTVANEYGVPAASMRVIHLAVEKRVSPESESVRAPRAGRTVRIGHIGGMTAWRDQRTLLLAQHRLRAQGIDARLVMIGDGPMRPSLEALRRELGLEEVATFRGYQADLCDFFAAIDVYVNPAVAEGFGIAVVEAMLEGIPAILANAGAHPELVTDGVTGLLYPPKDAAQLAARIAALTDDETRAATLGAAGREFAQQSFGSQRYALAYLDAVRRLPPTANASLFAILS